MAATGFKSETSNSKKVIPERVTQRTIKDVVIGDALVCLGKAVRKLDLKVEETSTIVKLMGGGTTEVPFVHHTSDAGVDIPYGCYLIHGLGMVSVNNSREIVPELELTCSFEKGADEGLFTKLCSLVTEEMKLHVSMFKGKAIRVRAPSDLVVPKYIELERRIPVFLNADTTREVETNLMFPINHVDSMRELGLVGQRGVLLHGKYGVGKSLLAYMVAQDCVKNDRTFIICDNSMMAPAIHISRFMEPSALFVEDADISNMGTSGYSRLRNMLSGVDGKKGYDVMVVLTTNFLEDMERHDRSLLRPDRIDAIIELPCPNLETCKRIFAHYADSMFDEATDYGSILVKFVEQAITPAIIIEILKRAKMEAKAFNQKVTPETLNYHLEKMQRQILLSQPEPPIIDTVAERLASSLQQVVNK